MDPHLVIPTLADHGVIAAEDFDALLQAAVESGRSAEDFLINDGHVEEHAFYEAVATAIGGSLVDLSNFELPGKLYEGIFGALF
jgi:hypothetical protein